MVNIIIAIVCVGIMAYLWYSVIIKSVKAQEEFKKELEELKKQLSKEHKKII